MKTNVRDTSIAAYQQNLFTINQPLTIRVIEYLAAHGAASANMIATTLGIHTSTCSGILKPMKGVTIEELPEKRKCMVTGNTVYWLKLKGVRHE
jgi:antitoxin component HigA of HigAB toxin-antitoxin module